MLVGDFAIVVNDADGRTNIHLCEVADGCDTAQATKASCCFLDLLDTRGETRLGMVVLVILSLLSNLAD